MTAHPTPPKYTLQSITDNAGFFGALARYIMTANTAPNTLTKPQNHSTIIALGAGALLALGHAPTHIFAVLYISIPIILWQILTAKCPRGAFKRGYMFGMGYFTAGLYWIATAMITDPTFAWLIPFALLGIPAIYSVGIGGVAWLTYRLQNHLNPVITFTALWVLFEIIRGSGTLAFPWLQIGMLSGASDGIMQGAWLVGVHGLSALFVGMAGLIAMAPFAENTTRRALYSTALIIPLTLLIWGNGRIAQNPPQYTDTIIRLVQPSIQQQDKWNRQKMGKNLQTLVALSNQPLPKTHPHHGQKIDLVLWAETAYTYAPADTPDTVKWVSQNMPNNAPLITGVPRITAPQTYDKIYNSMQVFENGKATQYYDKINLVPFGEFIPYQKYLPKILGTITGIGTTQGQSTKPITIGGKTYHPLICYEIAFKNRMPKHGQADAIINITNDAWFGNTTGPHQHLAIAKIRAIETGLPVIRVTNTGITTIITPTGKTTKTLPQNQQATITTQLPKPLKK